MNVGAFLAAAECLPFADIGAITRGGGVVIVAPHPDDEVLGCGGALALFARAGRRVLVVGVTDGEASHPGSVARPRRVLVRERRQERQAGLARLGIAAPALALGIVDGDVTRRQDQLTAALLEIVQQDDVLLTTWRFDGHPDHEATGRATVRAATLRGCRCIEMPVWMWHWAHPDSGRVPWQRLRRLPLDAEARRRKDLAIAAHASQLEPIPAEQRGAVLPDWALARLLRPFEVFFDSETAS